MIIASWILSGHIFLDFSGKSVDCGFEIGKKSDSRETGPMSDEVHKMTNKVNVKSTHAHKT